MKTQQQLKKLDRQMISFMGWIPRLEKSKLDARFTCVIVPIDCPPSVRSKAYKWSDTELCCGSFDSKEHPNWDGFGYLRFSPITNPADCALVRKKICAEKGAVTIAEWEGKWTADVEGLSLKTDWHESEEIATCELANILFTPPTDKAYEGGKKK